MSELSRQLLIERIKRVPNQTVTCARGNTYLVAKGLPVIRLTPKKGQHRD